MSGGLPARDAAVFLRQAGSTPVAQAVVRAEGCWLEDDTGHRVLDAHGNTCHNLGHAHPAVVAAVRAQIDGLCFVPRRFTGEPAVALAERLAGLWPWGPAKILLGVSGSDAIEMALKLSWAATGRRRTLGLAGAWHGAGVAALWAGGRPAYRAPYPVLAGCETLPAPWGPDERAARDCLAALQAALAAGDVACLIAEPLGAAHKLAPPWFWPQAEAALQAAGALLILDEVPTGLGRTGRLFAAEHIGVRPDMTVLGKSLGGGVVPLSALVARAGLDVAPELEIGHYTHQKSPVLAAAGLAVLDITVGERLPERAAAAGARFRAMLDGLVADCPAYRATHGLGMLLALELAPGVEAEALVARLYGLGLNATVADGRFLALSLPLVAGEAELAHTVAALRAAA